MHRWVFGLPSRAHQPLLLCLPLNACMGGCLHDESSGEWHVWCRKICSSEGQDTSGQKWMLPCFSQPGLGTGSITSDVSAGGCRIIQKERLYPLADRGRNKPTNQWECWDPLEVNLSFWCVTLPKRTVQTLGVMTYRSSFGCLCMSTPKESRPSILWGWWPTDCHLAVCVCPPLRNP